MGRTLKFFLVFLVLVLVGCDSAPVPENKDLDALLDDFLEKLYQQLHTPKNLENSNIYEQMQGDQPTSDNHISPDLSEIFNLSNSNINMTEEYYRTARAK